MRHRILVVARTVERRAALARCLIGGGYSVELAEGLQHARLAGRGQTFALAVIARKGLEPRSWS